MNGIQVLLHLLAASLVSGAVIHSQSREKSTTTYGRCLTHYDSLSLAAVPTVTFTTTTYINWTRTHTRTPTTTSTPARSTTTVVSTRSRTVAVTAAVSTDTTTVHPTTTATVTAVEVTTESDTSTNTVVSTTVIDQTTTVPTVSGFTPIASSDTIVSNGGATEVTANKKRNAPKLNQLFGCTHQQCPARYPARVECYETVDIYSFSTLTVLGPKATITASPPVGRTVREITTATSTTTITPADTTETVSSVSTVLTTKTQTTTTTTSITVTTTSITTSYGPLATEYAACAPDNIISHVGNEAIVDGQGGPVVLDSLAGTVEQCCIACFTTPDCTMFFQNAIVGCILYTVDAGRTCDPTAQDVNVIGGPDSGLDNTYEVGNGPCGQAYFIP